MEAAAALEVMEGPVITVISKRIRALRKKLNRISQMEDSISNGKALNKEQEETLRSKPSVIAGIEELEKLRQPLTAAVDEEISLAIQRHQVSVSKSEASIDASPNCEDKSDEFTENKVESTIEPNTNVTYSGVRLKLKKIFDSQYSTSSPVMNFGTHQVQVQESIPSVDVQVHVEGAGMQYQQKEEPFVSNNENETNNGDAGEEHHQEEEDSPDLTAETVSVHQGLEDPVDVKEQHVPRRPYNNYNNNNNYRGGSRGGRHRGNYNGRGGRGREAITSYQNGGHDQYYDQPVNYRLRNFEHRGGGGRGGRGGGYYNNNNNHNNNHNNNNYNNHRAYGGGEGGGPGGRYNRDS
ncbi:unnamed protein product [Cuscuta campestris]|uniref:Uncharacterized protein n=1 Tax=Cuscuta campestris TaxID=132261 RepID=A0A484KX44_9ASTE|nr:unnamed protein product [Cuscuta campestris]